MPVLTYTVSDFQSLTDILSADVNSRFSDIRTLLNTTKLDDDNIQNAGITRSTKLKAGTASHVIINDADGKLSSEAQLAVSRGGLGFLPSLTGQAGNVVSVKSDESGLEIAQGQGGNLTVNLSTDIATLVAGEGISERDAVCLTLDSSGNYRVFKADSDALNRKTTFVGFAMSAATVVANIKTYTLSAALVTGNITTTTINGRTYATTYASSSDETLQAIATQIATDTDIASAVVTVVGGNQTGTDDRVVTVTGKGGLPISISAVVTSGASQATITVAETQAFSGQTVRIRTYGVLAGFTGLTTSNLYYLSSSAGEITKTPADASPQIVGQALSTTTIFINGFKYGLTFGFSSLNMFIRSHGDGPTIAAANAKNTVDHFNFTSWSSGTADTNARRDLHTSAAMLDSKHYAVDGQDTGSAITAMTRQYNATSWASASGGNRATPKGGQGCGALTNAIYFGKGSTDNGLTGATAIVDSNNGTSWTAAVTTFPVAHAVPGSFVQGSKVRFVGGSTSGGSGTTVHDTWNGTSQGSDTARPASTTAGTSSGTTSSVGIVGGYSTTDTYKWDGSSWSSAITATYASNSTSNIINVGSCGSRNLSTSSLFITGGVDGGSNCLTTSALFNGTSWASSVANGEAKSGSQGSTL